MYKKKPFFIVFEGIEGCGKSYQGKKLYNRFKKKGISTVLTREPGGTKSSELIRNLILKDYFTKDSKEKNNCLVVSQKPKLMNQNLNVLILFFRCNVGRS